MTKAKYSILALELILLISVFFASAKSTDLLPTKLRITVIDGLGNMVEGATVTIYLSEEDYRENKNAVMSGKTDNKGRIVFKDLEPISYFLDARTESMNNDGKGAQTAVLLEGRINTVNTVIE